MEIIIMFLLIAVVVFVICREVVCWYFKINELLQVLDKIEENTRKPKNDIQA